MQVGHKHRDVEKNRKPFVPAWDRMKRRKGMSRLVTIIGLTLAGCCFYAVSFPPETSRATVMNLEEEWQIHAKWCTTDRGSSHAAYINACTHGKDQFDSVLACQAHNGGAQNAIRNAGRAAVNAFMDNWKSSECP